MQAKKSQINLRLKITGISHIFNRNKEMYMYHVIQL